MIGGGGFSTYPEEIYKFTRVDYGVVGQGERALAMLVDSLIEFEMKPPDGFLETIPGTSFHLGYFTKALGLVWTLQGGNLKMNEMENPGYDGVAADYSVLDYQPYASEPFSFGLVTGHGCNFNCSYCDIPHLTGKKYKTRSIPEVFSLSGNLFYC